MSRRTVSADTPSWVARLEIRTTGLAASSAMMRWWRGSLRVVGRRGGAKRMVVEALFYSRRRGDTEGTRAQRAGGHTDTPRNDPGIARAHAARAPLAHGAIGPICTTRRARPRRTAEIVNESLRRPLV